MQTTRHFRWLAATVLLAIATPIVVWGVLQQGVAYKTGRHQTGRGEVFSLPEGRFWVTNAWYAAGADRMLVYASGGNPTRGTQDNSGGYWLLERAGRTARLIHDNFDGSLWWGASLSRVEAAKPSPDGRYVAAFRKSYSEAAKSIRAEDPEPFGAMESALESYHWELIEVSTGSRTSLMDLTEEWRKRDFARRPGSYVWLDNERLAFAQECPEPDGTRIYTMHIGTRRIQPAITEPPGSCVAHLRRVSDGKLLYHVQSREALDEAARYMKATMFSQRDGGVARRLNEAGSNLKLADLRGEQPVVRTLELANGEVDLRSGVLSPDERYYAFRTRIPGSGSSYCLAIVSVQTGRLARLEGESSTLCGWHPDGTKVLAVLSPDNPTDPPGVLAEIPVADVCQSLN